MNQLRRTPTDCALCIRRANDSHDHDVIRTERQGVKTNLFKGRFFGPLTAPRLRKSEVWSIGVERERRALPWMTSVYCSFNQTRTLSMTLIGEEVEIICVNLKPAAAQSV